ncbi:MAG: DUF2207 domain-containing protein [Clostridium sp.]|nr:DUF2207 domain-containing protein [Clostridium sp.]MCM1181072.1 DUF2207 domain-containing protein [Clostridium sp.]
MKKKKIYRSRALNAVCLLDRALWLILVLVFVYAIAKNGQLPEVIQAKPKLYTWLTYIALYVLWAFVGALIPVIVLKVIFYQIKKQLLRNARFITVEDFDYYRDKLTGLSPGIISILADLSVERKKDISASILKYQEMGILKYEDNRYMVIGDYQNARLRESDRYLIEGLVNQTFLEKDEGKWAKLVEQEAIKEGYITNPDDPVWREKNYKKSVIGCVGSCLGGCLTPIILFCLVGALLGKVDINHMDAIVATAPVDGTVGQYIEFLNQNFEFCMGLLTAIVAIIIFLVSLIFPVLVIAGKIAGAVNKKPYRRTEYGNQMTEYVFGMKNFIHDFSNLNEANQEHLVLWDDYLIYAVVLEENQQIIDEIRKRRNKR